MTEKLQLSRLYNYTSPLSFFKMQVVFVLYIITQSTADIFAVMGTRNEGLVLHNTQKKIHEMIRFMHA